MSLVQDTLLVSLELHTAEATGHGDPLTARMEVGG